MKRCDLMPQTFHLKQPRKMNISRLKNIVIVAALALAPFIGQSQTKANGKVLITGTRFTYPLVEKWIGEFKKAYPDVEVRILSRGTTSADSGNLIINAHQLKPEEIKAGYEFVNISRYALLPVSNSTNPLNEKWLKKGFKESDVKEIFFEGENYYEDANKKAKKKPEFTPTVYTREQKACAPTAFAQHFGYTQDNIKGKGVSGDDKFLIYAIKKDSSGITYNNPGYIYDVKSRAVVPGVTVIPYDLNENGKVDDNENFYANLDDVITNLESSNSKVVPVEFVNISFPKTFTAENNNLKLFLDYVLNEGQKFNHEFGLLNLDESILAKQKALLGKN
jgi:phosphate transport system substrate-binding protein